MKPARPNASELSLLPEPWELIESFQETCIIAQLEFRMAGFTARRLRDGVTVSGSACDSEKDPADRAFFELMERIGLVTARSRPEDTRWFLREIQTGKVQRLATSRELFPVSPTPDLWVPAKSNGVALGVDLNAATQHALFELMERHLVLASWYGASQPRALPAEWPLPLAPLKTAFRLEQYAMGEFLCEGQTIHAAASFLWPLEPGKAVIHGFAAHNEPALAATRSLQEALQRLCFLYDAELEETVTFSPTAAFHQDYFLQPSQQDLLRSWLRGEHFQASHAQAVPFAGPAYWVDLTPEGPFPGRVVQVFAPGILPLMFGRYAPAEFPALPASRLIHPIM